MCAYVYLPQEWNDGLQWLSVLKYYIVLKRESRINLGLEIAKNTHYIKKFFKKKLLSIKFNTKKSVGAYVYLPQDRNSGDTKTAIIEIL